MQAPSLFYGSIVAELHQERPLLGTLVFASAAVGISQALLALAAGLLARGLATGSAVGETALKSFFDPWSWSLPLIAYFGLGATLVKGAGSTLLSHAETRLARAVGERIRLRVVDSALKSGIQVAGPELSAALGTRVQQLEQAVSYGALGGLRALAQLVPLGACLIWMSPVLAAAGIMAFATIAWVLGHARGLWRCADERAQQLSELTHREVDALVMNSDLWRTYGAGHRIRESIVEASHAATTAEARVRAARAAMSSLNEVLAAAALLGGVGWAASRGVRLDTHRLLEFAAVFFISYRPLRDLSDSRGWTLRGINAIDNLGRLADDSQRQRHVAPSRRDGRSWPLRTLSLAAFGHRARGPLLSREVEPGTFLCLVGGNGTGKSTLLRSLLGLDPSVGQLRYGALSLDDAPVGPTNRPFAWVPQDAPLITGTVIDNICLVGAQPTRARTALKQLGAQSLLTLAGQQTLIGPCGRPVSGGERRLIALARALTTELPVLLIDEPTSELDAQAASDVVRALSALRGHRTLVVVTHDPRVAESADAVVHIAERGSVRAAE